MSNITELEARYQELGKEIEKLKTEALCRQQGERLEAMYMRTGKTNVKAYEYSCGW